MSPIPEEREKPAQEDNNEIEDTEYPDVVINADSSDSSDDDGEEGYMGYQTLSQAPGGPDSEDDDDEDMAMSEDTSDPVEGPLDTQGLPVVPQGLLHNVRHEDFPNSPNLPGYMQVPDLPRPDKTEMLWNQPQPSSQDIKLDTGKAEKIRSLMSGIQLPSSNIPDWAKGLSDDQWQAQVVNRLANQKTSPKQEAGCSVVNQKTSPRQEAGSSLANQRTIPKQEAGTSSSIQTRDTTGVESKENT